MPVCERMETDRRTDRETDKQCVCCERMEIDKRKDGKTDSVPVCEREWRQTNVLAERQTVCVFVSIICAFHCFVDIFGHYFTFFPFS